jgi:hypothetical protein
MSPQLYRHVPLGYFLHVEANSRNHIFFELARLTRSVNRGEDR